MAYKIEFVPDAAREFAGLDGSEKKKVQKYIDKIATRDDPKTLGEALQANLSPYWKYRVGDIRLIAEIQDEKLIVLMLVIGNRRNVYKIANKRLC